MSGCLLVVCPNPALDRFALVPGAGRGGTCRATEILDTPGGKGVHVALVAAELGAKVKLVCPLGGRRGGQLKTLLEDTPVVVEVVEIEAETRETITVVDPTVGDVLEVIGPSPSVGSDEAERLFAASCGLLKNAKLMVVSGSLPRGVDASYYGAIITAARDARVPVFVDTSGDGLEAALAALPDLVKLNVREAMALMGATGDVRMRPEALARVAAAIRDRGVRQVVVTAGASGAVVQFDGGETWVLEPPLASPTVNAVGCGDALLAGMAVAFLDGASPVDAVVTGVAAATDKLGRVHPGQVNRAAVEALVPLVQRRSISDLRRHPTTLEVR